MTKSWSRIGPQDYIYTPPERANPRRTSSVRERDREINGRMFFFTQEGELRQESYQEKEDGAHAMGACGEDPLLRADSVPQGAAIPSIPVHELQEKFKAMFAERVAACQASHLKHQESVRRQIEEKGYVEYEVDARRRTSQLDLKLLI
jgi:hypothetical protein